MARSMPARGNALGMCPRRLFRPARAEDSCALAGRTDRFRNPGRCPGLACGGAFSAGINVMQIRIQKSCWLAIYEMAASDPQALGQKSEDNHSGRSSDVDLAVYYCLSYKFIVRE